MKYILSMVLILDTVFQTWAVPNDVNWHIYYDLMHNLFIFSIGIWALISLNKIKFIAIPIVFYFGVAIFLDIISIGFTKEEYYIEKSESAPYYLWSILALILISIVYLLFNKSLKRKWHEWKK